MEIKQNFLERDRKIKIYDITCDYRPYIYVIKQDALEIILMPDKSLTRPSDQVILSIDENPNYFTIEKAYMVEDKTLIVILIPDYKSGGK